MEIILWGAVVVIILLVLFIWAIMQDDEIPPVVYYPAAPVSYGNHIVVPRYPFDNPLRNECFECGMRGIHYCKEKPREEKKMQEYITLKDIVEKGACKEGILWWLNNFDGHTGYATKLVSKRAQDDRHSDYAAWLEKNFPSKNYVATGFEYVHGMYNSNWHYGALVVMKDDVSIGPGSGKDFVAKGEFAVFRKFADNGWAEVEFVGKEIPGTGQPFVSKTGKAHVKTEKIELSVPAFTYVRMDRGWFLKCF